MIRVLVGEQAPQGGNHAAGASRAVPRGQPGGAVRGLDERAIGAALPARRAQPQGLVAFDLPAPGAGPGRVFGLAGPGAGAAPAGILPQIARPPAARAWPLSGALPGPAPAIPAHGGVFPADPASALRAGP